MIAFCLRNPTDEKENYKQYRVFFFGLFYIQVGKGTGRIHTQSIEPGTLPSHVINRILMLAAAAGPHSDRVVSRSVYKNKTLRSALVVSQSYAVTSETWTHY